MNIISPLHTIRTLEVPPCCYEIMTTNRDDLEQGISCPVGFTDEDVKMDDRKSRWCDECMLFHMLERQRITKLKGLYKCSGGLGITDIGHKTDAFSLELPPRYQGLDLSAEWFFQQQYLSIPNEGNDEWKSGLDEATLRYLTELAKVLSDRFSSHPRPSTPVHLLPPSPITITPPSTPLLFSFEALGIISPSSLDTNPEARKKEVDLSDEEIMSLWSCTLPSEDGVSFDTFE